MQKIKNTASWTFFQIFIPEITSKEPSIKNYFLQNQTGSSKIVKKYSRVHEKLSVPRSKVYTLSCESFEKRKGAQPVRMLSKKERKREKDKTPTWIS